MKKPFFVTLIMGMAFAAVLAGCVTTGGGGTSVTPDKQAEQLAADLNAIKAGNAVVEGAKVTLTTSLDVPAGLTLNLTTGLIVPAGVTLDLTADGAMFELRNGAVLTVDGTVNARGHVDGVEGGLLCIDDGTTVINGSGTIRLRSKGSLFDIGSRNGNTGLQRQLILDGVTLVGLEDNNDSLVVVYEGELIMKSGAITGNTRTGENWSGGGGVQVAESCAFTMEGGTISGNTVNGKWASGGGVYGEGAFTMNGGKILGNFANGEYAAGGGVYVEAGGESATFILAGGEISGNSVADKDSGGNGGGVFISTKGIFTMKGGTISNNDAAFGKYGSGGGVYVHGGDQEKNASFIMEGGTISGNSASWTGGVDVRYATFTMKGGRIQGSTDSDGFTKNIGPGEMAALSVYDSTAKWGTGGAYTKGGVSRTGGSDIVPIDADSNGGTDDTLIATPAK